MNAVVLTWREAEPGDGLVPPERYLVLVQAPGSADRVVEVTAPASGATVTGLRNGVEASFTVYAVTDAGSSGPAGPIAATPLTGAEGLVAGLIVGFEDPASVASGQAEVPGEERVDEVGMTVGEPLTDDAMLVELTEPVDVATAKVIAAELAADDRVAWAEPDQMMFPASESAWNLDGQFGVDALTPEHDAGTAGSGVTVAVIDTGITAHPDLDSRLVPGYDFVSNPEQLMASRQPNAPPVAFDGDYVDESAFGQQGRDPNPSDPGDWRETTPSRNSTWHGTEVAGVIADVAPGTKIEPVRALTWRGGLLSDIASSITWAAGGSVEGVPPNGNPAHIINLSLSAEAACPIALQEAIDGARSRGSVIVAAAGNANDDASKYAPGNCNGVITVGATDRSGMRAPYSNYGSRVDISAPGGSIAVDGGILTTSNTGTVEPAAPTVSARQGTSLAAAHVSAGAAVLKAHDTSLTPDGIERQLTGQVRSFGASACDSSPDVTCGSGILTLAQVAADPCTSGGSSSGGYYTVTLTAFYLTGCSGTWTRPTMVTSVDVLVVGGGGGGGAWVGGGGGGGGVTELTGQAVSTNVAVVVGGGGTGAVCKGTSVANSCTTNNSNLLLDPIATPGGSSSFGSITATGGGYGGSYTAQQPSGGANGGGGGSSTGGSGSVSGSGAQGGKTGGTACAGCGGGLYFGGGGAGAGANGGDASSSGGGSGGNGYVSTITGLTYGGGGGGGAHNTASASSGGSGGGGKGNAYSTTTIGESAPSGRGGGGGGGGAPNNTYSYGGQGGQGTVVIRYLEKWLSVSAQPSNYAVGSWVSQVPKIQLVDVNGNALTGAAYSGITVTAAFTASSGSGTLSNTTATTDANGVATFSSLALTATVGTSGTLSFTASGYGSATSSSFSVVPGPATAAQSTVSASPSSVTANGTSTSTVTVTAKDADGNLVSGQSIYFEVASGTGTLSANTGTTNASGVATVSATSTTAGSVTVRARLGSTAAATAITQTASVTFTAGAATKFVVTGTGTMTAGGSQAITVTAKDAYGNTDTTYAGVKSLTFSGATSSTSPVTAPTVGGTAFGTATSLTFTSGIASGSMVLYSAETSNIVATQGSITTAGADRLSVAVSPDSASKLLMVTQPVAGASGSALSTQPVVRVSDQYGNTVSSSATVSVTPSGGVLSGSQASSGVAASSGTATFTNLTFAGLTSSSYTLSFASSGLTSVTSSSMTPSGVGSVASLVITGSSTQTAGGSQTITVTAKDSGGNTATGYTGSKSLTFSGAVSSTNPVTAPTVGGTAFGTATSLTFTNGVATGSMVLFSAEAATVSVTDGTYSSTGANRLSVTVSAASANKLVMVTQPVAGASGSTLSTQPAVRVSDQYGNTVSSSATVTVTASGGTLGGTEASSGVATSSGTATFTNLTFAGLTSSTYSLTFASSGLTSVTSASITPSGPGSAASLVITATATQTAGGSQTITVTAKDSGGNTATGYTGSKSLTFSGASSSTSPVTAPTVAGTAFGSATSLTFSSGVVTGSMVLYSAETSTVSVTDGTYSSTGANRLSVTVSATTASKLVMVTQPVAAASGSTLSTQPAVRVSDQYGNTVSSSATVTVTSTGGVLGGAQASSGVAASAGTATFTNLTFAGLTSSTYTLTLASSGLTSVMSASVTPSGPGSAASLVITGTATQTAGGSQTITVTAKDSGENTATGYTGSKSLTFSGASSSTSPVTAPTVAGTAFGTATSLTFTNGVATGSMVLYAAETSTVSVSDGTYSSSGANRLTVTVSPSVLTGFEVTNTSGGAVGSQTAGTAFNVKVRAVDAYGNTQTAYSSTVTLTSTSTISAGGTSGSFTAGVLASHSITLTTAGSSQTITATGTGSKTGTSAGFTISATTASKLVVDSIASQTAGTGFSVTVTLTDTYGNAANNSGAAGTVTLTRATGGGTLAGTTSGTISIGSSAVTITGVTYSKAESGVSLTATGTGASSLVNGKSGTSGTFTVVAGSATKLQVLLPGETAAPGTVSGKTGSPTAVTAGSAMTVTVNAVDANWNLVSTATPTVAITSSDGSATLPTNAALVAGTKAFSVTLKRAGSQTVTATDQAGTPLTAGTSASVTVNSDTASAFVVTGSSSQTAGGPQTVTITATDAYGNTATAYTGSKSLTFSGASSSAGPVTAPTVAGTAFGTATSLTFTNGVATGTMVLYAVESAVVVATQGSITTTGASRLTVAVAPAVLAGFEVTNTSGGAVGAQTAGTAFNVKVRAVDAYGNTQTAYTSTVTLTSTSTVSAGGMSVSFTAGVLASHSITLTTAGSAQTITATGTGSKTGTSASFTIGAGAASVSTSVVSASPSTITADGSSTAVATVTLKDAYGNALTASGGTLVVSTNRGSVGSTTDNHNGTYTATLTAGTTAGTATISATLDGNAITSTASVTLNPGVAAQVLITTQPVAGASGSSLATQPVVRIADANGNTVTSDSSTQVTVSASGGVLGGTKTVTAVSGVVTFARLTFAGRTTSTYTLTFASGSLTPVTSASITPTGAGSASTIAINAGNGQSATAGSPVSTNPSVLVTDAQGNPVSGTSVTFAVGLGSGSLASSGTVSTDASGIAASPAWTLGTTAGANTLTATSGSLTGSPLTFSATGTAGSPASIAVTRAAAGAASGAAFTTQPKITFRDANGNTVTTDSSSVVTATVSAGGTRVGTVTATASSGVATFSTLGLSAAAGAYTLTYSSGALSTTQSITVTVGVASALSVSTSASGATYDNAWIQQPIVTIIDSGGNRVSADSSTQVTLAVSSGGALSGTTTATASSGLATFTGLSLTGTPATYMLTFTAPGLASASQSLALSKSAQTITFDPLPTRTYGASPFTISSTASSRLTVAFTSSTTSICTVLGATVTIVGAGTCSIDADQSGNGNYLAASTVTQTFTVNQAAQSSLTVTSIAGTFGSALTLTTSGGTTGGSVAYAVVNGTASGCSATGAALTSSSWGTCLLTATMAGNTDYLPVSSTATSVTLAKRQITVAAAGSSITYGATVTASFSVSSGTLASPDAISGVTYTYEGSGSTRYGPTTIAPTQGGTYTVTPSGAAFSPGSAANYVIAYDAGSFAIGRASQAISFIQPLDVTYGDAPYALSPTSDSGLPVSLASSDASVCSVTGLIVTVVGAGSCSLTASQAGNDNFTPASPVVRSFTVAQAAQAPVNVTSTGTVLFGQSYSLTASGGSGTGSMIYLPGSAGFPGTAGCSITTGTGVLTYARAGTCTVKAQRAADTNYLATPSSDFTITIEKAGQTVAFSSPVPTSPMPLGSYTPTASAISTVTGSSSGVTPAFTVSGACTISGGIVAFTSTGPCTVTASAAANANYTAAEDAVQVIVVGALNQNITFPQPGNADFGSSSVAMSASASSGETVTYVLGSGTTGYGTPAASCSVTSLGVVTIGEVGTCEVIASAPSNAQYAAASPVTRAFQILVALPTAPRITSASASSQAITVGYTAPGFAGGEAIAAYRIVATPVGSGTIVTSTACAASPCAITGLENGTAYTVTIAAINSAGTGPASSQTGSLTPATAAYAVGSLSATPGDGTVTLTWAPLTTAQLGGGTFTRYEISRRVAGTGAWTVIESSLTPQSTAGYAATGLDNGTSYDFQVVAITSANTSEMAGNTAQVVQYPSTVPSAPRALAVLAATATEVQFSWAAPLSDGGSVFTSPNYTVTVAGTAGAATVTCIPTGTDTFCMASGLTNDAVYTFSVVANNRMGASSAASATYGVPSSDATLAHLVVTDAAGPIALSPSFDSGVTSYAAAVPNEVSEVTVTPTATMGGSTVTVDGGVVVSGAPSAPISLAVGENSITVVVTALDPRFSITTTIAITRAAAAPSGGGAATPGDPLHPDLQPRQVPPLVASGQAVGAVSLGGEPEDAVLVRNSTDSGWSLTGRAFALSVATESSSGRPVPMTRQGVMQVPQGGLIVIRGDGYVSDGEVTVFAIPIGAQTMPESPDARRLTSRNSLGAVYIGSIKSSSRGTVQQELRVPDDMVIGDYVLQVNGQATMAEVRSVSLRLRVNPAPSLIGPPPEARVSSKQIVRAGFFQGGSDRFADIGMEKLRAMVDSIPGNATNVRVNVVGASTALGTATQNLVLASERAQRIVDYLQARGVKGSYTVAVYTSFDVRSGAVLDKDADVPTGPVLLDGKPLTTTTITFDVPVSPQVSPPLAT